MKLVIQLLLWIVIIFLGYLVFNSVYQPIQFNKVKEKRYAKVIERLQDIRAAQLAHREVTGTFASDFNQLVQFIDTAEYVLTQRRDTMYLDEEYRKTYGVDQMKEDVIIDTLGYASVKDSIFKDNRHKRMMEMPIAGADAEFEMEAGHIIKNEQKIPVFEARVRKADILWDQDRDLILQENEVVSVEAVNGKFISVGSMTEVNTTGNWPKVYGNN